MKNNNKSYDSAPEFEQPSSSVNRPSDGLIEPLMSETYGDSGVQNVAKGSFDARLSDGLLQRKENHILRTLIAALFLIVFAYNIWQGIDSTIVISRAVPLDPIQWTILLSSIVAPFLLWSITCWLMWTQSRPKMALALFVAWAVSSMVFLDLNALISVTFL